MREKKPGDIEKEPEEVEIWRHNVETYFEISYIHNVINNQIIIDVEVAPKQMVVKLVEDVEFRISFGYKIKLKENGEIIEKPTYYERIDILFSSLDKTTGKITADIYLEDGQTFESAEFEKPTIGFFTVKGKILIK